MTPMDRLFPLRARAAASLCAILLALFAPIASAQLVTLAQTPLYGGRSPHPNVAVSMSVEFPTVGAAYNGIAYNRANTYLGYFDASKCYSYNSGNGGYFDPSGNASALHECSGDFSGNFMNWATMSAIDEFRYAMTGGNRDDENGPRQGVILKRAYLPDGTVSGVPSFYAYANNFPRLTIAATTAGANTPFSGSTVYVTNCKSEVYFGTTAGGSCAAPAKDLGGYAVRVNVCDQTEGPARTDLCLQYTNASGGNGKYKPVGQVQLNADQMRFAVFGYLMDRNTPAANGDPAYTVPSGCDSGGWNRCRYGGVLRAPMKYIGPTAYDVNLSPSTNTKAEINAKGEIEKDPEGTAITSGSNGGYSGFINYINRFGSSGVYKRLDPGGEMFYEAIRYFQNLGPSPEAISGTINKSVADFYPYSTSWTDPIVTTCSANYIINLSDANTWDDTYIPGFDGTPTTGYGRPTSRAVQGGLDAKLWASRIGFLEKNTTSIAANDVRPGLFGMENRTFANQGSYLDAGAAFWANVNDIRDDLPGKQTIKTISFDVAEPAGTIQDRQLYLMGKYGGFTNTIDRSSDAYPNPFWAADPNNINNPAIRSNREWEDSPGSASPANYLLASSPQKLISGLRAAFQRISTASGNLAGAGLTSSDLTTSAQSAFVTTFTSNWGGTLLAKVLSATNGMFNNTGGTLWDSGALLLARCGTVTAPTTNCDDTSTAANKRNIVTLTQTALGATKIAVPFTGPAIGLTTLGTGPWGKLNVDPATGNYDGRGSDRINYLRGNRTLESGTTPWRVRDSVMGDVINSNAFYAGPPTSAISDASYQAFIASRSNRTPAVYVGSNDGMLHAFNAATGAELFAYVPYFVSPYLNRLTDPGYVHMPFVDGKINVQESQLNGTWKTVLVGSAGGGVQGIFALDVSDPGSFGPSNVLWEFTDEDDADFGNVMGTPQIAKLWVSGPATAKVYRYFAIVTGYNNKRTTYSGVTDSNVSADTANQGVLFMIALDHGLGTAWQLNTDYYKFKFPAAVTTATNGLGPVTLLASKTGDGSTAAMYFGDLQGRVWRVNTDSGNPTTWAPPTALGTATSPLPLFEAKIGSARQPITAAIETGPGPYGGTMLYFGTGRYLGSTDATLPGAVQSEYALFDIVNSVAIDRTTDLVPRTATVSGSNVTVTGAAFSYSGTSSKKGWYVDLPSSVTSGERSIYQARLNNSLLTFTTVTLAQDVCGAGSGYIYQVNALTGLPVSGNNVIGYTSTVGIPGPPALVDLDVGSSPNRRAGEKISIVKRTTLVSGTSGNVDVVGATVQTKGPPIGRINWREITNWNDQKNAP